LGVTPIRQSRVYRMNPQPDQPHAVRRVVLPSGKTIEVVYFADSDVDGQTTTAPGADLHVCPECTSQLVYPTAWEEAGEERWQLLLRCPNCEWDGAGIFDRQTVERLDEELDHGTHALLTDLKQLMHANMEEEIERFIAALQAGAIHPMDF
jgi:hypothetical protein